MRQKRPRRRQSPIRVINKRWRLEGIPAWIRKYRLEDALDAASPLDPVSGISDRISPEKAAFRQKLLDNPTAAETLLWERLNSGQFQRLGFERQAFVLGWIVDFYSPSRRTVVELDGPSHLAKTKDDAYRDGVMRARGLRVLRIPNRAVHKRPHSTAKAIAAFALLPPGEVVKPMPFPA